LTIPGLTPGRTYRLQLISVAGKNAGVVVEGSSSTTWTDSPAGTPSVLTATWVQGSGDTQLNVTLTRNHSFRGNHDNELAANGYALHDITPPAAGKDIITFTFPTYGAATITGNNITLTVPNGTPVTAMAPTYTMSANATGSPVSGTTRSFSNPQTYTITAQDLTTKTYTVTVTPVAPPVQPTNLVATPGSNTVGLTWSASGGATGYNVKRANVSGGPYATLGTTSTTSYSDGTALNGTTYYYVVSATNGGGEGANSAQASATPALQTTTTTLASSPSTTGAYGTAVTFTATVAGASASGTVTFKEGLTVLGSGSLASGTATLATSALTVGAHSVTAIYGGDATFATSTSAAYSYTVTAKPVTITGVTAAGRIYDKTNTAVLTGGTVSGVVGSETVTVVAGTGTFASTNVGSQAVTATGYALAGPNKDNYVLLAQPTVVNVSIAAKALTVSGITAAPKVYDGSITALLGGAAALLPAEAPGAGTASDGKPYTGDTVSVAGTPAGILAAKHVGTQAVTITGNTPGGAQAGNYTLTQQTGLTQTVTPKALLVSGLTMPASKPYDGNTTATVTGTASGLMTAEAVGTGSVSDGKPYTGDTVTLSGSATGTGTYNSKDVATANTVTYGGLSLAGAEAGNYVLQAAASITPMGVILGGNRNYDGTMAIGFGSLTIQNKVIGDDVGLSSGVAALAGRNVGSQACLVNSVAPPARIGTYATGSTGASAATSFSVTVPAPANGNTLIAVISTRSTNPGAVSSIFQSGGAAWTRAVQTTGSAGTTTEIWYASNIQSAGTTVTVNLSSALFASGAIAEYGGVLAASPADQTANSTGTGTSAVTGTTATTAQANELWIGGIGLDSSTPTLVTPLGGFTSVANAQSGNATATSNAKVYVLEKLPGTTGAAASGGTISGATGSIAQRGTATTAQWSSGSTLTINKPTGVVAGDLMLVCIAQHVTSGTPSAATLSGWSLVQSGSLSGSSLDYGTILSKVAGPAEGSSYAFTLAGTVGGAVGDIVAFSGVDNTTPVDAVAASLTSSSGRSTTMTAAAINTVSANAVAVLFGMTANASNGSSETWSAWSAGLNATTPLFANTGGGSSGNATSVAANWKTIATAGTTGSGQATLSRNEYNAGIWVALRPIIPQWSGAVATFKPQPASLSGTLALGGTAANNYTLAGATGAATIAPLPLTVAAVTATKSYDGTTGATGTPTLTSGAIQSGDTAPLWTQVFTSRNATPASGATLTPVAGVVNDGNGGNNYSYTYATAAGTINKAPLTVTAVPATRTYDGTTAASGMPTLTAGTIQPGDTAPSWTQVFASRNATPVNGATLTPVAGVVNDGNGGNNYSYAYATAAGTINKAPLTVTAVPVTRIYDGTTAASGMPTLTSGTIRAGDTAPSWTQAFASRNATPANGATLTPVAGVINDGNGGNNYSYAYATAAGTINPLPLTVAAVMATKTYDDTTTAPGTPSLTPGLVGGDIATVLNQAFETKDAGTSNKVLVPAIAINDGNGGANYAVTLQSFATGTIIPASATITLGGLVQPYDGNPKSVSVTTDPPGLAVTLTYDGSPTAPSAKGSYAVAAIISDANYAGTAAGTQWIGVGSFGDWQTGHFTSAEITAGYAADDADPDGDGFTNLTEYIMGTDPKAPSLQPITLTPAADNHFTLSFFARSASGAGYEGLTRIYTLEATSDLAIPGSWQGVAGYTHIVGGDNTVSIPLTNDLLKKFYRLSVRVE